MERGRQRGRERQNWKDVLRVFIWDVHAAGDEDFCKGLYSLWCRKIISPAAGQHPPKTPSARFCVSV